MNEEWVCEQLDEFIKLTETRRPGPLSAVVVSAHRDTVAPEESVLKQAYVVERILDRLTPGWRDLKVKTTTNKWMQYREAAIRAREALARRSEIEKNLAPEAPHLSANELHPWVWEAAQSLWGTKHYREAVQAAATSINAHLQDIVGRRDLSDYKLTTETFSDNSPAIDRLRLRWPGEPTDEEYKSMQTGIRNLGAGIFQSIRNSTSHKLDELSEQDALERLAAMSLFCRLVEECRIDDGESVRPVKRLPIGVRMWTSEEIVANGLKP